MWQCLPLFRDAEAVRRYDFADNRRRQMQMSLLNNEWPVDGEGGDCQLLSRMCVPLARGS